MRKLSLALATDGEAFDGASIEKQALGGSETALVQMARVLAGRGHKVQVFCRCPQPGVYNGVLYRDRKDIVRAAGEERFDALIVSRFFSILDLPWQAGLRVLWNHDILDQPPQLAERLAELDACLVLSRFHAANFIGALPECATKLITTRNGLDLSLIARASQGVGRVPGRMCYVSRPERGLKLLLEKIWPRLLLRIPHLTLHICGYEIDETDLPASLRAEYAQIRELIKNSKNIEYLGALPKARYYAHLASCQALLYPCVFPEISCLAVLEAQALGTAVFTSNDFALKESVMVEQFKVAGQPGSDQYVRDYLARVHELLSQPALLQELSLTAQQKVHLQYDWSSVAQEWEDMLLRLTHEQEKNKRMPLCAALLLSGDRQSAANLYGRPLPSLPEEQTEAPPADPQEEDLLNAILDGLGPCLRPFNFQGVIGFVEPEERRSLEALAPFMPGWKLVALQPGQPAPAPCAAIVMRDILERVNNPHQLLAWAIANCHPEGWLALCVASGAWPLLSHGYLARKHDLGREDIIAMLPGRPLFMNYLPRGLVGSGAGRMAVGRWLALARVAGPEPVPLQAGQRTRYVRPAPPGIFTEMQNAGLL